MPSRNQSLSVSAADGTEAAASSALATLASVASADVGGGSGAEAAPLLALVAAVCLFWRWERLLGLYSGYDVAVLFCVHSLHTD
jgi:hypothetical protein